jgi:hypothetical protein
MLVMEEIIGLERLNEHKYRVREIRRLQKEIDIISAQLSSPGGVRYSDMPRSQNPFDKMEMLISRKIEKEKKINAMTKTAFQEAKILEDVIQQISKLPETAKGASNSVYQDILRYHYLSDISMKEIVYLMNYDDEDLIDNYESRLRVLYSRENEALRKFIKCQKIK